MAANSAERQRMYKKRMRSSGYVQVTVWVRKEYKDKFIQEAKKSIEALQ